MVSIRFARFVECFFFSVPRDVYHLEFALGKLFLNIFQSFQQVSRESLELAVGK